MKKRKRNEDSQDQNNQSGISLDIKKRKRFDNAKGCSCKKTGCLKRYCDCFTNGIRCTDECRCIECKNYDGSIELQTLLEKNNQKMRGIITPKRQVRSFFIFIKQ